MYLENVSNSENYDDKYCEVTLETGICLKQKKKERMLMAIVFLNV
jgi:hypothetical protein